MRWKARLLSAATMASTAAVLWPLLWKYGDRDLRVLVGVVPALVAWIVSMFWPRCPFCGEHVIRDRVDWLAPSPDCPNCRQTYDGPYRAKEELDARDHEEAVRLLAKRGVPISRESRGRDGM